MLVSALMIFKRKKKKDLVEGQTVIFIYEQGCDFFKHNIYIFLVDTKHKIHGKIRTSLFYDKYYYDLEYIIFCLINNFAFFCFLQEYVIKTKEHTN